jgi:phosphohistidine phosphatase
MILYLIRHGLAAERGLQGEIDDDLRRPLTSEGRKKTRKAVRGMAALFPAPDIILASAALRSVETAEMLSTAWKCRDSRSLSALNPGATMDDYVSVLNDLVEEEGLLDEMRIAFVTHQPELGEFLGHLIANHIRRDANGRFVYQPAACICFGLKKASLAVIDWKDDAALVEAILQPGTLRRIAKM